MRLHVTDLSAGDILEVDTFNRHGLHVLQKDTTLGSPEISKLMQHGIDYVDVTVFSKEEALKELTKKEEALARAKPNIKQAVDGFENIFLEAISTGTVNNTVIDDVMHPLVDQLRENKDVVSLLLVLDQEDDYTYQHSMQVGMLSYYIATWLGYSKKDAYTCGKAGYLHDIGKCRIPPEILNKAGKLTPEEYEIVKLHTTYGYEIIRNSSMDEVSALVALQHHERDDGSGYPLQINEHNIHPFSQITAVADVFSAMTTHRVYQSKQELLTVLKEIFSLSFGKLNGKPTQAFIRHMLPNFIGKEVILSSEEVGTIIMNNNQDFFRPLVKVDTNFIDLSIERHISIKQIIA
ncbi:HD-GYP domain-containing protein [Paenibacillus sp. CMAA1364]